MGFSPCPWFVISHNVVFTDYGTPHHPKLMCHPERRRPAFGRRSRRTPALANLLLLSRRSKSFRFSHGILKGSAVTDNWQLATVFPQTARTPSPPLLQPYENLVDIWLKPAYARCHLSLLGTWAARYESRSRPDVGVVRPPKLCAIKAGNSCEASVHGQWRISRSKDAFPQGRFQIAPLSSSSALCGAVPQIFPL